MKDTIEKKVPVALVQFFNVAFRVPSNGQKFVVLNDEEVNGVPSASDQERIELAANQPHLFKK